MAEDEAVEEKKEEKNGGGMLSGIKGPIIIVIIILAEAGLFIMVGVIRGSVDKDKDTGGKNIVLVTDKDYNAHIVRFEQLNFSIPTSSQNTGTLSLSLAVVLGKTKDEMQDPDLVIAKEDWEAFMSVVNKMQPNIRDMLNGYVTQQSINNLNSSSGKEKLKARVQEFINTELARVKFTDLKNSNLEKRRVTAIYLENFYLQQ